MAHRTSPTNIGLSLSANLAAFDFGYLTGGALLARTSLTLASIERLDRHRGHFYNWYDTRTLEPLSPTYISTVDSGNLAGHLLTLACGLEELATTPVLGPQITAGLSDTLALCAEQAHAWPEARRILERLAQELAPSAPTTPADWQSLLERLAVEAHALVVAIGGHDVPEPLWWARAFESGCREALAELTRARGDAFAAERDDEIRGSPDAAARCRLYAFVYDRTRRPTCLRSATTSRSTASIRATTTCSPPRRASRASSPSPRATCARPTGFTSGGSASPRARARRSSRGAARCSST